MRRSVAALLAAGAAVLLVGCAGPTPAAPTGDAPRSPEIKARLAEATATYQRYVVAQVATLVPRTRELADAVKAGRVDPAKALFPSARAPFERIEPIAESFATLDARLDGREDDPRDPGVAWTGFHRLEKDLWVDGLQPDSPHIADQLVADVTDLQARAATLHLTPDRLAVGAKELLDEFVNSKITGEEDRYSHTDLWDFRANVEGSQAAVAALRPVIDQKDPALGAVLDARFAAVETVLAQYRTGDGFRSYAELGRNDTKKMTDAIDALSEPISKVAGVVGS